MDVKKRILELMDKRGWTKYRLAKETGIYITTINDWFSGKGYTPSRESIVSICEAMGITVAEFYGGIEEHDLTNEQLVLLLICSLNFYIKEHLEQYSNSRNYHIDLLWLICFQLLFVQMNSS